MKDGARMAVSLLCALGIFILFQLMRMPLLFSAVLAMAAYFGFWYLFKPVKKINGKEVSEMDGGEKSADLLAEGKKDLETVRQAEKRIQKPEVRADVHALGDTAEKILQYMEENPSRIHTGRRFLTYYLDTCGKVLMKYADLCDTGLKTEEVEETKRHAEAAVKSLREAFEKQYTALLQGDIMDMEADMDVLQSMLKKDEVKKAL